MHENDAQRTGGSPACPRGHLKKKSKGGCRESQPRRPRSKLCSYMVETVTYRKEIAVANGVTPAYSLERGSGRLIKAEKEKRTALLQVRCEEFDILDFEGYPCETGRKRSEITGESIWRSL